MFELDEDTPQRGRQKGVRADHLLRFRRRERERSPLRRRPRLPHRSSGAWELPNVRVLATSGSWRAERADEAPQWSSVVALEATPASDCPICLEPATAAAAGPCGHVFCAACVVRHLEMTEVSRSRLCPCCAKGLTTSDLRPVRFFAEDKGFALLARYKASRAVWAAADVSRALPTRSRCSAVTKVTLCDEASRAEARDGRAEELAAALAAADDANAVARAIAVMDIEDAPCHVEDDEASEKIFRFYGRADGAPTFLHPLVLRCLRDLPERLEVKVKSVETFVQCVESRKRLPWLGHVQLGTEISLVDVDLDDIGATVDDPALQAALDAREARLRRERDKKRKVERRHSRKAKPLEPRRRAPSADFTLDDDDFAPLCSPPSKSAMTPEGSPAGPSFAALVARGFAAELGCPALGASPSSPRSGPVWPARRPTTVASSPPPTIPEPEDASHETQRQRAIASAFDLALSTPAAHKKKKKKQVLSLTGGGRRYSRA